MSNYNFYSAYTGGRPIRLCESTRKFAWESLQGKYGDDAMITPYVSVDEIKEFDTYSPYKQYDLCLKKIVSECKIRIIDEEKVCGAATLGAAIWSHFPAYKDGKMIFYGINHLTIDFYRTVRKGIDSYIPEIEERLKIGVLDDRSKEMLESLLNVIDCFKIYRNRYLEAVKDVKPEVYNRLLKVPFGPSETFAEAVQSLWFTFSFTRLSGNWPGIGRIDEILGPYLEKDLAEGLETIDSARELLASFFIKGCEWIRGNEAPTGSGDAQHYQNIILGGTNGKGEDITNEVSYLVLDVVEELAISDFPITVRVNSKTPDKFLTRVSEVMRHGGGIVAVYNEALILDALRRFGYPENEIHDFANDGCWEVQIPGKTRFSYCPFDGLQILLNDTLRLNTENPAHFESFEELYKSYKENLNNAVKGIAESLLNGIYPGWRDGGKSGWRTDFPTSVVNLFEIGCIEKARGYLEGGPKYTAIPPHIGGAPDVGNSLLAIDKLCFKDKKVSFDELMKAVHDNWEGHEVLRQYVKNKYTYYGNDNPESDSYTSRILNDFADMCNEYGNKYELFIPSGVSTFGRQIEWLPQRTATPFGMKKGEILSGNASPTPGTDISGATAIIRSYCSADLVKQTTGAALDIKLFPGTVAGENGVEALKSLIKGFCKLGGYFMQLDVMDAEILKEAQENPEKYKTLSVRVSGWNARFVTLNREWQQMIIERTSQNVGN